MLRHLVVYYLGLVVLTCSGCSGCTEYQSAVDCKLCNGVIEVVKGEFFCSKFDAHDSARDLCTRRNGESTYPRIIDSQLSIIPCDEDEDDRVAPSTDAILRGVMRQAPQLVGLARESEEVEEPTCPATRVNLKITFHHDYQRQGCAGDPKEVKVYYYKYVSEGSAPQYVTVSKMVPAGGHAEIICTDAILESGKVATFRVAASTYCTCTIDEGCYTAQAFSQMPGDGSSLVIHEVLEYPAFIPTVIPPEDDIATAPSAAPAAARGELLPVPDPMFTSRSR